MMKEKIDNILTQIETEEKNKINSIKKKYSVKKKNLIEKQKEKSLKKILKAIKKLDILNYSLADIDSLINLIKDFDKEQKIKH